MDINWVMEDLSDGTGCLTVIVGDRDRLGFENRNFHWGLDIGYATKLEAIEAAELFADGVAAAIAVYSAQHTPKLDMSSFRVSLRYERTKTLKAAKGAK